MQGVRTSNIVLIVTNRADITADLVILEFQRRQTPYVRFNTEDFPQLVQVSWELEDKGVDGYIRLPRTQLALRDVRSVWYRRPSPPAIAETVKTPALREFAYRESQEALSGLWRTLDCFWMSRPDAINLASYKPRQLKVAKELGFKVPRTLISNAPNEVERFRAECRQIVAKPLFSGIIGAEEGREIVFTTLVPDGDPCSSKGIEFAPILFQEYVPKDLELRVTVVGKKVLAASINSQQVEEAIHDWRRASVSSLLFRSYTLPKYLSEKCARLVAAFGLTFGTIDLVKTPDGSYVFLELNPNGQWGWLERATGDPYAKVIAMLLERGRV